MLYIILGTAGLIGDVIAIWLALHSLKHEKANAALQHQNTLYLMQIVGEVHSLLKKEDDSVSVPSRPEEYSAASE